MSDRLAQQQQAYKKLYQAFSEALKSRENIDAIYENICKLAENMGDKNKLRIVNLEYADYLMKREEYNDAVKILEKYDGDEYNEQRVICYIHDRSGEAAFKYLEKHSKEPILRYVCLLMSHGFRFDGIKKIITCEKAHKDFLKMIENTDLFVQDWEIKYVLDVIKYVKEGPPEEPNHVISWSAKDHDKRRFPEYLIPSPISRALTKELKHM